MTDWNEHEDAISDAISDSIDMDWTSRTGAKAVVAWLNENAAAPAAPQAAGVGELLPCPFCGQAVSIRKGVNGYGHCKTEGCHANRAQIISLDDEKQVAAWNLRTPSREPEGGAVDERLKWFLKVIEGAGGEVCSTESRHNPINVFCEDRDKGDDTFNISEAAGYTQTSHDTSFDTSTTRITDKGRTYLSALATPAEAGAISNQTPEWRAVTSALSGYRVAQAPYMSALSAADIIGLAKAILTVHPPVQTDSSMQAMARSAELRAIAAEQELEALRAQPQAREDALPVAWAIRYAGDDHKAPMAQVTMSEDFAGVMKHQGHEVIALGPITHPAPDALRVAVEAAGFLLDRLEDLEQDVNERDFYGHVHPAASRLRKALAALQAEQKGGA